MSDPRDPSTTDFGYQQVPTSEKAARVYAEAVKMLDEGKAAVAFSLFPTTVEDLIRVSDAGSIMPPKSTWFEPKLRSGLFVHELD